MVGEEFQSLGKGISKPYGYLLVRRIHTSGLGVFSVCIKILRDVPLGVKALGLDMLSCVVIRGRDELTASGRLPLALREAMWMYRRHGENAAVLCAGAEQRNVASSSLGALLSFAAAMIKAQGLMDGRGSVIGERDLYMVFV